MCLEDDPDQPIELHVGDTVILPGECARAERGGGVLRLRVVDGRGGGDARSIRLPASRRTHVRYADDRLRVDRRHVCDRRPE